MTADLGALVYVCVSMCVCVCPCVSEVLCLKRMNHLLCHLDAGRIGRFILARDKKKTQEMH